MFLQHWNILADYYQRDLNNYSALGIIWNIFMRIKNVSEKIILSDSSLGIIFIL